MHRLIATLGWPDCSGVAGSRNLYFVDCPQRVLSVFCAIVFSGTVQAGNLAPMDQRSLHPPWQRQPSAEIPGDTQLQRWLREQGTFPCAGKSLPADNALTLLTTSGLRQSRAQCSDLAQPALQRARRHARTGRNWRALFAAAHTAFVRDPTCLEAALWLSEVQMACAKHQVALKLWDELWATWGGEHPPSKKWQTWALRQVLKARVAILRTLPTARTLRREKIASGPTVRIAAVGDVHLGRGWRPGKRPLLPPREGKGYFDAVSGYLSLGDVTLANLETALLDEGESRKCIRKKRPEHCHSFRSSTVMAKRLAEAGIDLVSVANNHAGDFGMKGLFSTWSHLQDVGVETLGLGGTVNQTEIKGTKIAFAAFGAGRSCLGLTDIESARRIVSHLAANNDVVVVTFHGGAEGWSHRHVSRKMEKYLGEKRGNVYDFAHAVVDAGADLVVGHGPHVMRAMEIYRDRLIAYSLGNFSSWYTFPSRGPLSKSAVLVVDLAANGVLRRIRLLPTKMEKSGRPVPDPKGWSIGLVRSLSDADFGNSIVDDTGFYLHNPEVAHQVRSP